MRPAHSAREISSPSISTAFSRARFNEARAFSAGNLEVENQRADREPGLQ